MTRSKRISTRILVGDFETTVFNGQTYTEVWASALVEIGSEDVTILTGIEKTFEYLKSQDCNLIIYYHNLKFDGEFWLSYIINHTDLELAYQFDSADSLSGCWEKQKKMKNNSYEYVISDLGQWYSITIKVNNHTIELRDSLKLIPLSVKEIGKAFKTKHQKLDMEYEGYRYSGCEITQQEREYIANDVLVIKEALELFFAEGHNKLTIGSCCMSEFKKMYPCGDYEKLFPDLTEFYLNPDKYGEETADEYIRKSYRGGWCYLVKGKENKIKKNGTTADVNSLYPSMMSSESGNRYPVGKPTFWVGDIPEQALKSNMYYFVRISTRFKIKKNMLPFIQIKHSLLYKSTEILETSDFRDRKTGQYSRYYRTPDGEIHDTNVTLTLTMTDFELLKEHYNLYDLKIISGCYFYTAIGLFDEYINKYKKIKMESKGGKRTIAKLFLNNLYGKLASSTSSNYKVAVADESGIIHYGVVPDNSKKAGYIAIGSAITSYARNFTIRAAQKNYYGVNKRGFIYADTDSIHCDLQPSEFKGIKVDDNNFCCWKLESGWDIGYFVRAKTYIEHVTGENQKSIKNPYYNVKCAGMPQRPKDLFVSSLTGERIIQISEKESREIIPQTEEEEDFLKTKREITDFKEGLQVPSKLKPHRINGGVILENEMYTMRPIF